MSRRLRWEQARREERIARANEASPSRPVSTVRRSALAQSARADFVARHEIACFKCGATSASWAKTGLRGGQPWAICLACVRGP